MKRRTRSRRSGGDSWPTRAVLVAVAVLVVALAVTSSSLISTITLERTSTTDVVDDPSGVVGLQAGSVGSGTTGSLTNATNRLDEPADLTVSLTGNAADWGSLEVGGVDYGDAASFADLPAGGSKAIDVSLQCRDALDGASLTYSVDLDRGGMRGALDRSATIERRCLTWYTAADWDAGSRAEGVVTADVGDHDAADVELGYDATEAGLVSYWPLDEDSGSTAVDAAGGNDGTLSGPTPGGTGILGTSSYAFDGTGDEVSVPHDSSLALTGDMAVSAWVRFDTTGEYKGAVGKLVYNSPDYNGFALTHNGSDYFQFMVAGGGVTETVTSDATHTDTGQWYHVAGVRRGGTNYLYVNGVRQAETGSQALGDSGNPLTIGRQYQDFDGRWWDGQVDAVRVYNRSLSDAEVAALANGATPDDPAAAWNGTHVTGWETTDAPVDASGLTLTDVVADVSGGSLSVRVDSDPDGDGAAEETSDPIALDGSTGPYDVTGIATNSDRFRLRVEANTTSITTAPCFSGATLTGGGAIGVEGRDGCGMTNATANAAPTAAFTTDAAPWYDGAWGHRKLLTVDHDRVGGNLTNYPMLVNVTDADLAAGAQADADDVLFTAGDGTTKLDHEVESYDPSTGTLVAWVQVPQVNATAPDTALHLYYNNSAAANQENPTGVWDGSYAMVQHLEESSGSALDSTSNSNDGSVTGATQGAAGRVDGAYDFAGGGDEVSVPHDASLSASGDLTVSAWVRHDANAYMGAVGKLVYNSPDYNGYSLVHYSDDTFGFMVASGGTTEVTTSDATYTDTGTWHHVVGVRRGGTNYLYVDGVEQSSTGSQTLSDSGNPLSIGRQYQDFDGRWWDGAVDEVRVSDSARSAAWIGTVYNNTADPAGFHALGVEQSAGNTSSSFDASASSDPDGTISTYMWDWDDDGTFEDATTAPEITHAFASPGTRNVTLRVIDDDSEAGQTTQTVHVVTESPSANFTADGSVGTNLTVAFDATGSSDPDGTISTYKWDWDADGTYENSTASATINHTFGSAGFYDVTLEVVDDAGATDAVTKTVAVDINQQPTAAFTQTSTAWYDGAWGARKPVTVDHTKVAGDLSDFPVLVSITDADLAADAQADADDVLFTAADGTTKLDHEVESYDGSTGTLVAWVEVPQLDASNDTGLFVYYDNAGASNQEDPAGTWSNGFATVYHFANDSGAIVDSTGNGHDAANAGLGRGVPGRVGPAVESFANDSIAEDADAEAYMDGMTAITVEAWVRSDVGTGTDAGWLINEPPETGWDPVAQRYDASGYVSGRTDTVKVGVEIDSTKEAAEIDADGVQSTSWQHFAHTWSSGDGLRVYLNATDQPVALRNAGPYTGQITGTQSLQVGQGTYDDGTSDGWDGTIDEVRIHSVNRSAAWLSTSYATMADPAGFVAVGSERTVTEVAFDASGSSDPDGSVATYEWDWDADGTYEDSTASPTIEHDFAATGDHLVTLRVVDDEGATNTTSTTVSVG